MCSTTGRNRDDEFTPYQLKLSPEKAHSLMAFASLFIGDSQTMTSEAAGLGVPSIRCNSFVDRIAYLEEEEHRYGLTFGFRPDESEAMFEKLSELLQMKDRSAYFHAKRDALLADKIDYTAFLTWFV